MVEVWGYLSYDENIVREVYEVSGGDVVYCGDRISEVKGSYTRLDNGCILLKGELNKVSAASGWIRSRPPFSYRLPAIRHDPYRVVELQLTIDSDPKMEFYGAPYRKSTVISLTRRSVLEGRVPPQLLVARPSQDLEIIGEETVKGDAPELAYYVYPVMGPNSVLDLAKLCEAEQGYGLDKWGPCIEKAASYYSAWSTVRDFMLADIHTSTDELVEYGLIAFIARRWAPMIVGTALNPLEYVAQALSRNLYTLRSVLSIIRDNSGVIVEPRMPIRLRLLGEAGGGRVIYERVVETRASIEGEWVAYAYLCRECWEPL